MKPFDLSLYYIVDSKPSLEQVREALEGGVTLVQLRMKSASTEEKIRSGKELLALLKPQNIPLIVNDSPDLVLKIGAQGVHLGQSDGSPREARSLLGQNAIIGLSIENFDQLYCADLGNIDYVAASPVFATQSKQDFAPPMGITGLLKLKSASPLPIVAIGGINEKNIREIAATGIAGVAVISAIQNSPHPKETAEKLRAAFQRPIPPSRTLRALTIAGSDSGGGAGIQADLKTFQSLGCFGVSAITAITAQNTTGVQEVTELPASIVVCQIDSVLEDLGADAIKVGMLFSEEIIEGVQDRLVKLKGMPIVVDPVAMAKGGSPLLKPSAVEALRRKILPLSTLLTPNLPEAELLTGLDLSHGGVESAAAVLLEFTQSVLIKGGHSPNPDFVTDYFADRGGRKFSICYPRIPTKNTHGTGCTYSSAIAAHLARGFDIESAIRASRNYLQGAIQSNANAVIGAGHGPVDHAWNWKGIFQ